VEGSAEVLCSGNAASGRLLVGDGCDGLGYALACEAICSGKSALGSLWVGDGSDPLGYALACEAVCSGKSARDSRFFGDGEGGLGYTLCLVGADGAVDSTSAIFEESVLVVGERNALGNAGVGLFLDMVCIPFYFATTGLSAKGNKRDEWDGDARSWARTEPRPSTGEGF
jgi:hypothetical protein